MFSLVRSLECRRREDSALGDLLLGGGEIFEEVAGLLLDDLPQLPDLARAGEGHEAVGLEHGHPVVDVAHDDELLVGGGDVGAGAVPVHVQKGHLQGLFAEEPQAHLLILQDLLHRHQSVTGLLLLGQLGHAAQDHEVALAEAVDHLAPGLARLTVVVLRKGAHLLAGLSGLEVVLVAAAASVHEGLALLQAAAVRPAGLVGLAGPLEAREAAGGRQLPPARQHAGFIGEEVVPVLVALTVGEGEAAVALGLVVPADALLAAVVRVGTLQTLLRWKRQVGAVGAALTFGLSPDHHQGEVRGHAPSDVAGRAGINAGVVKLRVVYDQLADVGDHDVPPHVVGLHDGVLFALQLLLPGDLRTRLPGDLAQEASRLAHEDRLLGGAGVYGGELDVGR